MKNKNKNKASRRRWKLVLMAGFLVVLAACSGDDSELDQSAAGESTEGAVPTEDAVSDETVDASSEELEALDLVEAAAEQLQRIAAVTETETGLVWANGETPNCVVTLPNYDIVDTSVTLLGDGTAICNTNDESVTYGYSVTVADLSGGEEEPLVDASNLPEPEEVSFAGGIMWDRCTVVCISTWTDGSVTVLSAAPTVEESGLFLRENLVSVLAWVPTLDPDRIDVVASTPELRVADAAAAALEQLERIVAVAGSADEIGWEAGTAPDCPFAHPGADIADLTFILSANGSVSCGDPFFNAYSVSFAEDSVVWDPELLVDLAPGLTEPEEVPFAGGVLQEGCAISGFCLSAWTDGSVAVVSLAPTVEQNRVFFSGNFVPLLDWFAGLDLDGMEVSE